MKPKWMIVVFIFLICVLAGSITGNVIGYRYVNYGFDKYNDSRLDPLGEKTWRLLEKTRGFHDVVLLGDSHARNWEYPHSHVLNLGIPSQTSVQIKLRSDLYHDSLSGTRLIITAGGNDIKSISTNLNSRNEIVATCLNSIEAIILNHKEKFKEVVLVTVPPAFKLPLTYRLIYHPDIDTAHKQINAGIRRIAKKHKLVLLDSDKLLKAENAPKNPSDDGIHLNKAGYAYLFKNLPKLPSLKDKYGSKQAKTKITISQLQ